jgi:hypothetical protein
MAKKSKFIVDHERKTYLKQLEELSAKVNPKKYSAKEIERLKKQRLEMRNLPY